MKDNIISVNLNSFTKEKVKNLINLADKLTQQDKVLAKKYLLQAEYYIKNKYQIDDIFNGCLNDLFGYGTGCPLKHTVLNKYNDMVIVFFIKLGINPTYENIQDEEFLNFG